MLFLLEPHAEARRRARDVREDEIAYALSNFYLSISKSDSSTMIYSFLPFGYVLKVIVEGSIPLTEPVIVKTVAWEGVADGEIIER